MNDSKGNAVYFGSIQLDREEVASDSRQSDPWHRKGNGQKALLPRNHHRRPACIEVGHDLALKLRSLDLLR